MCQYLKGGCKEDRARLFSGVPSDNGHKRQGRSFPVNIRKPFFTVRVTEHWHGLARELVESPSLEILKSCLAVVLGHRLSVVLLEQGRLDQMTSGGPFPTSTVL